MRGLLLLLIHHMLLHTQPCCLPENQTLPTSASLSMYHTVHIARCTNTGIRVSVAETIVHSVVVIEWGAFLSCWAFSGHPMVTSQFMESRCMCARGTKGQKKSLFMYVSRTSTITFYMGQSFSTWVSEWVRAYVCVETPYGTSWWKWDLLYRFWKRLRGHHY